MKLFCDTFLHQQYSGREELDDILGEIKHIIE